MFDFLMLGGSSTLTPLVPVSMQDMKVGSSLHDQAIPSYYTGKQIFVKMELQIHNGLKCREIEQFHFKQFFIFLIRVSQSSKLFDSLTKVTD